MGVRIHPTAEVSGEASIGDGTSIWHHSQIRPGAVIGEHCIFGKGVYIDTDVHIGSNVKIQNYVSVFHGVCIEDGVFIGPHVCFTNDMRPRSINLDGTLKGAEDWVVSETLIKRGASLGANSTIRCGIKIGDWAMIGAGSVVTRDVPAYGLVYGNPAHLHGFCCPCGEKLEKESTSDGMVLAVCPRCGARISISKNIWESVK